VAIVALVVSGLCCLFSPFVFHLGTIPFVMIMILWGFAVIADSPQFSTLVAQTAPAEYVGTALTIVNGIGFAITIITIQGLNYFVHNVDIMYLFLPLTIGPILGLIAMRRLVKSR
jgi:MFS family permease